VASRAWPSEAVACKVDVPLRGVDQGREVSGRWTTPLSRALVVTESMTGAFSRPREGMVRDMMAPGGRW
jgi:hypothetical protein